MASRKLSRLQNVASTKLLRRLDAVCMGLKKENEDRCAMSEHFYMSFVQGRLLPIYTFLF